MASLFPYSPNEQGKKRKTRADYAFASSHYIDHICPICNKTKLISNHRDYVYKIGSAYYCSWTCYRKAQAEKFDKRKKINRILQ